MRKCTERDRLIDAYKQAIRDYIQAAGNLRYAQTERLRDAALAAVERASQQCEVTKFDLERHTALHRCDDTAPEGGTAELSYG